MAKEFARAFYDGMPWRRCRKAYIAKRIAIDGGLCEKCRERLGYMVHHTVMLTPDNINDPDVSLNHDKLEYVCKQCHDREEGHFIQRKDSQSRCTFDAEGNPIPIVKEKEDESV
ncbi:MAG: hypothetical protein LBN31_15430 [Hungatella sp.]|jgi:hypothetical protein|uniref:hypothetical protein n=1 Tax=Clostridium sp. NkU-1 TaxID=1095009 RepID=UPI0006CF4E9B|nr:hypothetical protein [Hungatella sp.]